MSWSLGMGYVPQTSNVFPTLTIEENLEVGVYQDPGRFDRRFAGDGRSVPAPHRAPLDARR